jgi:acyl-CoA synthetase (NDP forming)
MTTHRLDPLLKPDSIALMGASNRDGSPGRVLAELVINSSFGGKVYPVNPGYESLCGIPCYPDLKSLPQTVDHVVLAVSNERLEAALEQAIEHGARAATIYSSCVMNDDVDPPLKQRLEQMAKDAGIAICGGNCMGFYSITAGLYAGMYPMPGEMPRGSISFIAQSGSAFSGLAHNGRRLRFNLCVSSGNELATSVSDYMDWSLEQPSTRVIGLFLETVRNPRGFVQALQKAQQKKIPVVILKVGNSPLGAELANTHTGAIVGNHAAYQAVFRKYGVIEVSGLDELATTLMLFQSERRAGPGKLATIQESGGFMELVTDICHEMGIEFAQISDSTKTEIGRHLEPGLKADNPLDAWGSNDNFEQRFYACMSALMQDPAVATGMFFTNFRDGYYLSEAFYRVMEKVSKETEKPLAMVNCYSDIDHDRLCEKTANAGIPFLDGARESLLAMKNLLDFRDNSQSVAEQASEPERHLRLVGNRDQQQSDNPPEDPPENVITKWKDRLDQLQGSPLEESGAMQLLQDFSIHVPAHAMAGSEQEALDAANRIGYPVVMKTAESGISHKSDYRGVVVNIRNEQELGEHYRDFMTRLGPSVLVSNLVSPGTEVGLGMVNDPQFGPLIMISAGGVFIELLDDRAIALAPVSRREADEMISSLRIDTFIRGTRGRPAEDREALIDTVVRFSDMALALRDKVAEIDINPVIVNTAGATAVDALVAILPSDGHTDA